jgi:hypothetical protein
MANITGWGRGAWDEGAWGEALPIILTGLEATASVNGVGVNGNAVATVGSVTATLGDVTVVAVADANVDVTGQEATSALGTVAIIAKANVIPAGQESTIAVGSPTIDAESNVTLTGVDATSALGTVATIANAIIAPAGLAVSATLPPSANEWTANNGAAISTAQSKFGGASLLLDGVNDNVISNNTYDFQSTAFTIEFWARPANATQDEVLLDTRDSTSNPSIYFRQAGTTLLVGRGTVTLLTVNNVFSANTWVSLAVTRGDPFTNTYTVFVDGNNEGSILLGASPTASDIHIGSDFNNTNNWSGYIDEIRLSDIDRYGGAAYTPATSEFSLDGNTLSLLHLDGTNGSTSILDSAVSDPLVVTGVANIFPTGLEGTSALGTVTPEAGADVSLDGVNATLGNVSVLVDAEATIIITTGVSATGSTGTLSTITDNRFPAPGFANMRASDPFVNPTVNAACNFTITGVSATGQVGTFNIWEVIDDSQNPNWTEIAA